MYSDLLVETKVAAILTASSRMSSIRPVARSVTMLFTLIEKVRPRKKKNVIYAYQKTATARIISFKWSV